MLTQLAQSLSPFYFGVSEQVLLGFFCQIAGILGGRFDMLAEVVHTGVNGPPRECFPKKNIPLSPEKRIAVK